MGEFIQYVQTLGTVLTCVGIPLLIYNLSKQDTDRAVRFREMHNRMDHLDECIDGMQRVVTGGMMTRVEVTAALLDLREGIASDTRGLHDRIMRLENIALERLKG